MPEFSWYSFYVGDYQQKTAHLSIGQHGAYRLLLDHYYAKGKPLPRDHKVLYRICRVSNQKERQWIDDVLKEFFMIIDDKYHHKKCDEQIAKRLNYSKSQSANAQIRHSKRHEEYLSQTPCQTDADSLPVRVPYLQPQPKKKEEYSKEYSAGFLEFYEIYPLHEDKFAAAKNYNKAIKEGIPHETIIAGVRKYAEFVKRSQTERQFITHPHNWISGRKWENEYNFSASKQIPTTVPTGNAARNQAAADSVRAELGISIPQSSY